MSTLSITRDTLAMAVRPLLEQAEESVLYVLWQRSLGLVGLGDWTALRVVVAGNGADFCFDVSCFVFQKLGTAMLQTSGPRSQP